MIKFLGRRKWADEARIAATGAHASPSPSSSAESTMSRAKTLGVRTTIAEIIEDDVDAYTLFRPTPIAATEAEMIQLGGASA